MTGVYNPFHLRHLKVPPVSFLCGWKNGSFNILTFNPLSLLTLIVKI